MLGAVRQNAEDILLKLPPSSPTVRNPLEPEVPAKPKERLYSRPKIGYLNAARSPDAPDELGCTDPLWLPFCSLCT